MTNQDKRRRKDSLLQFGFGADAMKNATVCTSCNSLQSSNRIFCSGCGARLPRVNLYDYYKAQHRNCPSCGNVLSSAMDYCPSCGVPVKEVQSF